MDAKEKMSLQDSEIVGWGSNYSKQLALFDADEGDTIITGEIVSDLSKHKIIEISCGLYHCLALSDDGRVFTFGHNYYGQLGLGHYSSILNGLEEIKYFTGKRVTQVSSSDEFSCALTRDGKVYCWGYNYFGQLGTGDTLNSKVPIHVCSLQRHVIQIASGSNHCYALTNDGQIYAWGQNTYGQLGLGEGIDACYSPQRVHIPAISMKKNYETHMFSPGEKYQKGEMIKKISASNGNRLCIAITSSDRVFVFEIEFLSHKKVRDVVTGYMHFLALTEDGTLYSWGDNRGQLGYTLQCQIVKIETDLERKEISDAVSMLSISADNLGEIKKVSLGQKVSQIASGYHYSLALADNGEVFSWGSNSYGQLGHPDLKSFATFSPRRVDFLKKKKVLKIQASGRQSFAFICKKGFFSDRLYDMTTSRFQDCTIDFYDESILPLSYA